tara:strand:+ start:4149 stop:4643 length:495 start_codon:yes stop_codon:yes gene_type:complete
MNPIEGCGFKCERDKNIAKLKDLYLVELDNYDAKYKEYVEAEFKTGPQVNQYQIKANNLWKELSKINNNLNKILKSIKTNIQSTSNTISNQSENIISRTNEIHQKNKKIDIQDKDIVKINSKLNSKNRQLEFTKERNKYRLIMIGILITVNIVLIAFIIKYYKV